MSTELNGLASQTSSMFSDFFGNNPPRSSISACPSPNRGGSPAPSLAGSTGSLPTAVLSSTGKESGGSSGSNASQMHSPFPTGRKGLVERSSLIRHTTSHLHPQKGKTDFKMIQKLSGSQAATNSTSAENQAFISEVIIYGWGSWSWEISDMDNKCSGFACVGNESSAKWRRSGLVEGRKTEEIV
jgi:hypothetical protein